MIIDARSIPSGTEITSDLCIVGGGAAVISIAQAFSESANKIALVESGGHEFDEDTQSLYDASIVGLDPGYSLTDSRLRFFGGSTNHWAGQCHPLDTIDFAERDWLPLSGWPISRVDMADYYDAARTLIGLPTYSLYDAKTGSFPSPTTIDPLLQTNFFRSRGSFEPRVFTFNALNSADAYRKKFEQSSATDVYLNANATRVLSDANARQAEGISVETLQGGKLTFRARHYVLALAAR